MTRLGQILAVEKGAKTDAYAQTTKLHHLLGKAPLQAGLTKVYAPEEDGGETFPGEQVVVQVRVEEVLAAMAVSSTRLFNLTLTKDEANTQARADVVVDGQALLAGAPVTYLLFLEKQLQDMATTIKALPVLDPAERWDRDPNTGLYANEPTTTVRSKKIPRNHVKAKATDKHPEQVEVYYEDTTVGRWTTTRFSGAISPVRKATLVMRVTKLLDAVKQAREEANTIAVTDREAGEALFGYLLA
jgi:hypothetical protein